MPTRERPYLSVRVYGVGLGDPLCPDEGLGWYDILANSWKSGTFSRNASGVPLLEYVDGIGLACRPFLVPQNTTTSHFTTSGGSWATFYPGTGPRVQHLDQYDTSNTATSWSATWAYQHPANPSIAFSLILEETESDWDWSTYPPFTRIEFGGEWAVQFTKDGAYLMQYIAGVWTAVKDLPTPPRNNAYGDAGAIWIYVRVLRGQIGVSFDFGKSYEWHGTNVTVLPGRVVLRGRGSAVSFGIHQLRYFSGVFDSHIKYTDRSRTTPTVSFTGSRYDLNGGTVTLTDLGVHLGRRAQWRGTLAPVTLSNTLWSFYATPVLYAVAYDVAATVQSTDQTTTTPYDDHLQTAKVVKPRELDGSWAEFTASLSVFEALELDVESLRWRKMELDRGWRLDDGSIEIGATFVGYAEEVTVEWSEDFRATLRIKLHNASARFKRSPWGPFRQFALCGRTPNAAADFILGRKGLNSSYRDWHAGGATVAIPYGLPEEPNELTNPNELPWETLKRIFAERGLELGVEDNGTFFTVPLNFVNDDVSRTVYPTPEGAADLWAIGKRMSYRVDFKEMGTCALAYGTDENGQFVFQLAADTDAESNTSSSRFTPLGREMQMKELSGTPDLGLVTGHCQALAAETFSERRDSDLIIPVDPSVSRRERWALEGWSGMGIPDGTEFRLLTLDEEWDLNKGYTGLETVAGLQRIEA